MNPLLWFRLHCKIVDDERMRLLAFEDRWHFVAINCCKGQGIIDNHSNPVLLRRMLGVKLGLQLRELEALALRLGELDLIDPETFQPRDWDKLQYLSDSSTARVRKHRARANGPVEGEKNHKASERPNTKRGGTFQ